MEPFHIAGPTGLQSCHKNYYQWSPSILQVPLGYRVATRTITNGALPYCRSHWVTELPQELLQMEHFHIAGPTGLQSCHKNYYKWSTSILQVPLGYRVATRTITNGALPFCRSHWVTELPQELL